MYWLGLIVMGLLTMSPFPMAYLSYRWYLHNVNQNVRDAAREAVGRGFVKLALVNAAAVGVMAMWLAVDWDAIAAGKHSHVGLLSFICFHVVWWLFAAPVLRELERTLGVQDAEAGRYRAATLRPRTISDYLPSWWTWAVAAALVTIPSITLSRLAGYTHTEVRFLFGALFLTAAGVFCLLGFPVYSRRFLEANALSLGQARAIQFADEIEMQRKEWLRVWFAIHFGLSNVLMFGGLLFVEVARGTISESTAGVVGGCLGTTVGIAGGVLGVWFGRRAHVRKRLLNRPQQ